MHFVTLGVAKLNLTRDHLLEAINQTINKATRALFLISLVDFVAVSRLYDFLHQDVFIFKCECRIE